MSGASDQEAKENLVKDFERLLSQKQSYYAFSKEQRLILGLADNKQTYVPACLKIFLERNRFFEVQPGREEIYEQREKKIDALARPYLDKAVAAGYAPAQFILAEKFLEAARPARHSQEEEKAEEPSQANPQTLLEQAAQQGYAPAQFRLAKLLLDNRVNLDNPETERLSQKEQQKLIEPIISLLKAAAQAGNLDALHQLGEIYSGLAFKYNRESEEKNDHKKAAKYYLHAARRGYAQSIKLLGEFARSQESYYERGVIQQHTHYYQALKQLAEEGYVEAQYELGQVYQRAEEKQSQPRFLGEVQHPQSDEEPEASDSSPQTSPLDLAILADKRKGETAAKWYGEAAKHGHKFARGVLTRLQPQEKTGSSDLVLTMPEHTGPVPYRVVSDQKSLSGSAPTPPLVAAWDSLDWLSRYNYAWRKKQYNPKFLGSPAPVAAMGTWTAVEVFEYTLQKDSTYRPYSLYGEQAEHEKLLLSIAPTSDEKQTDPYAPAYLEIFIRRNDFFGEQLGNYNYSPAVNEKVNTLAQPYLDKAVKVSYAPAQFAQAQELLQAAKDFQRGYLDKSDSKDQAQSQSSPKVLLQKAEALLQQAVEQGYAPAQLKLAELLLNNLLYEFDLSESSEPDSSKIPEKIQRIIALLGSAKQVGNLLASYQLGEIYSGRAFRYNNKEVFDQVIDDKKAAECYLSAARQGDSRSIGALSDLALPVCSWQAKSKVQSDVYYQALKQLAEEGYIEAQYQLGCIYRQEAFFSYGNDSSAQLSPLRLVIQKDTSESKETAAKWYEKAAKYGHKEARSAWDKLQLQEGTEGIRSSTVGASVLTMPEHRGPVPYRVADDQKALSGSAPTEPSLEVWYEEAWLRIYDYNWRKQKYDSQFLSKSPVKTIEVFPSVDKSVFQGLPDGLGSHVEKSKNGGERDFRYPADFKRSRSGDFPPPQYYLHERLLVRGFALVSFILGAGLGVIALYFSGALITLGALGLGTVAPFVLAAALGSFLVLTLMASLQLAFRNNLRRDLNLSSNLLNLLWVLAPISFSGLALLLAVTVFASTGPVALVVAGLSGAVAGLLLALLVRWKNPIGSAPGRFLKLRSDSGDSGVDLDGSGHVLSPAKIQELGGSPATRGPVSRQKGSGDDDTLGSTRTLTITRSRDQTKE